MIELHEIRMQRNSRGDVTHTARRSCVVNPDHVVHVTYFSRYVSGKCVTGSTLHFTDGSELYVSEAVSDVQAAISLYRKEQV